MLSDDDDDDDGEESQLDWIRFSSQVGARRHNAALRDAARIVGVAFTQVSVCVCV